MASRIGLILSSLLILTIFFSTASAQTPSVNIPSDYLLYEDKQNGFSIHYPPTWEVTHPEDPSWNYWKTLAQFSPSIGASLGVKLSKDYSKYLGLGNEQFANAITEEMNLGCKNSKLEDCTVQQTSSQILPVPIGIGKMFVLSYLISAKVSGQDVKFFVSESFIPASNKIWNYEILVTDSNVLQKHQQEFTTTLSSFALLNTLEKTPQPLPAASTSVGELKINSNSFFVKKSTTSTAIIDGKVLHSNRGDVVHITLTRPDNTVQTNDITLTKDGLFSIPLKLTGDLPSGRYLVDAKYNSQDVGKVSFQLNPTESPQTQTTTTSTNAIKTTIQKNPDLVIKAEKKDDNLYVAVQNPTTSGKDVYSIQLLTTNGNIKNFIKIDGWEQQRIDSKTVIYKTTSFPLKPSDFMKIVLKVDAKTDLKWEAFSKDQKSLSRGVLKT